MACESGVRKVSRKSRKEKKKRERGRERMVLSTGVGCRTGEVWKSQWWQGEEVERVTKMVERVTGGAEEGGEEQG